MYKVSESCITSMIINKDGDKILIGDEDGKVSLVKLSKSFYSISTNSVKAKQAFLNSFLEREVNKEKAIDALLNLKGKKKVGKDDATKQAKAEAALKERLRSIESEYMSYVNNMWNETENKSQTDELHHQTSLNAVSVSRIENTSVVQDLKNADTSKEKDQSKEDSKVEEPNHTEENKPEEQGNVYQSEENHERLNSSNLAANQIHEEEQKEEEKVENIAEQVEEDKVEENKEEIVEEKVEENVEEAKEEPKEEINENNEN